MVLKDNQYRPPLLLNNAHIHTVFASKYRPSISLPFKRQRWQTPDKDFIDVDFLLTGSDKMAILGHGLEGNSGRPYITNTADLLHKNGWDVCAWNSRSCSGELNLQPKLYSHADTDDLQFIIEKMLSENKHIQHIALIGFSMGGAIILNYLGKKDHATPSAVKAAVAVSTPLDISTASMHLDTGLNRYYKNHFMDKLKEKIRLKAEQYPALLDTGKLDTIRNWKEFDEQFSAPLGGFEDAQEFYFHCSAKYRLHRIDTPTLIINSLDDPLLTEESYPVESIEENKYLTALYTKKGGHVAFLQRGQKQSFAEETASSFINAIIASEVESFYNKFEKS